MRNTFMKTIADECRKRDDVFIVTGDAGFGVLDDFQEMHPDRFLNLGVAEQNMASFSAGLSVTGFKVYMYNIIPFLLYRCYEQVRNDICYQKLPVALVGIGSGVTYAPQGMTHYSVEDIGLAQTLPNLTVISPADPVEARLAAVYSLKTDKPVYIRLAKRGEPVIHQNENFDITVPQVVRRGSDAAVLFHGSISSEAMEAYDILVKENMSPLMISVPVLQPLNKEILIELLKGMETVISVEEHFSGCGLGGILKQMHADINPPWRLMAMGIPHEFIHKIRDTKGMRRHFKITANDIAAAIKEHYGHRE